MHVWHGFAATLNGAWATDAARRRRLVAVGQALAAGFVLPLVACAAVGAGAPADGPTLAARVAGGQLVDASGRPLQLRGVNISGLESVAIQGWSAANPWGGAPPQLDAIRRWKANAIRLPLNEASWLGLTTYKADGTAVRADPGGNYRATVRKAAARATAAGLYVVLDLHWSAPDLRLPGHASPVPLAPMGQAPMADADHSVDFWASVAAAFKDDPGVLFDLFNEPYIDSYGAAPGQDPWSVLLQGGSGNRFPNNTEGGKNFDLWQSWKIAGFQSLIDAVRGTGATNVVLVSCLGYAKDPSGWLAHVPHDPVRQLALSVHLYPKYGATYGTAAYTQPDHAPQVWAQMVAVQRAGYPVIIGEAGDRNAAGTPDAPFMRTVTAWVDAHQAGLFAWTWNAWQNGDNILIRDAGGTPTDGEGVAYRRWLLGHP